jgi:hypothetical protein
MEKTKVEHLWDFSYKNPDNHILKPFRHLMLFSYVLETDRYGNRIRETIDPNELVNRVYASYEQFSTWKAYMEYEGIYSSSKPYFIDDKCFDEVKRLAEEKYLVNTDLTLGKNGHDIIELIHSSSRQSRVLLTDILEATIRDTFSTPPERNDDNNSLMLLSTESRWIMWVEVFASHGHIQNEGYAAKALKTINNFLRQYGDQHYQTYYVMCGPGFGRNIGEIAQHDLTLLWSLSVLSFIIGLRELRTLYSKETITAYFPAFFAGQSSQTAHSTAEGFKRLREAIGE